MLTIASCLSMVEPPANTDTHIDTNNFSVYDFKLFLKLEGNIFITRKSNKNHRKL